MSDLEPDDAVWKLLDHASKVEPSPYFPRRVVREAKALGRRPVGVFDRLLSGLRQHRALFATGTGAFAAITLLLVVEKAGSDREASSGAPAPLAAEAAAHFDPASEMADLEYLGQLMAVTDPGQLDDDALSDLFF